MNIGVPKSESERMKTISAAVTMPGRASGSVTRSSVSHLPAPRSNEACSRLLSMPRSTAIIRNAATAASPTDSIRTTPCAPYGFQRSPRSRQVTSPLRPKSMMYEREETKGGEISVSRRTPSTARFPRKEVRVT